MLLVLLVLGTTPEFASVLLVLGGGKPVLMGDEDSAMSFMLLPDAWDEGKEWGPDGSISEEKMLDEPLLSSDKEELELLVLLPPPLLRRRKKDAMVLGPRRRHPGAGLWGVLGGRRARMSAAACWPAERWSVGFGLLLVVLQLGLWARLPRHSRQALPSLPPWLWCLCASEWEWEQQWDRRSEREVVARGGLVVPITSAFLAHFCGKQTERKSSHTQPLGAPGQGPVQGAGAAQQT